MAGQSRPWSARPLDLVYFIFFIIHIQATIFSDLQALYPPSLIPSAIRGIPAYYLSISNDPLIAGSFGLNGPPGQWIWFKSFLILEAFFQLPAFFAGAYGLWKDSRAIYPLILVYATSACTTTLPCMAVILSTPVTPRAGVFPKTHSVSPAQLGVLLACYIPFLLVPAVMTVDMGARLTRLARAGVRAESAAKAK